MAHQRNPDDLDDPNPCCYVTMQEDEEEGVVEKLKQVSGNICALTWASVATLAVAITTMVLVAADMAFQPPTVSACGGL
jgi:hypothetical protein